jgi:hypothetical protein
MEAYAEDCVFADPFVSFSGVDRFKQNVGNLGGMMRDVKLDVYDYQESDKQILTKWRFSCILSLPWRPLLAAAGSTTHVIDPEAGCIVKHIEAWDVEPSKVGLRREGMRWMRGWDSRRWVQGARARGGCKE